MMRVTLRFRKRPPEPIGYICPWCGEYVERLSPDDKMSVNEHRLLHLAQEWGDSLEGSTGWTVDDDGGLRPVTE